MLRVSPPTFKPVNNLTCCKTGLMLHVFLLPVFPYIKWCANPNPSLHGMVIPTAFSVVCLSQTQCQCYVDPKPIVVSMVYQSQPQSQWYVGPNLCVNGMPI